MDCNFYIVLSGVLCALATFVLTRSYYVDKEDDRDYQWGDMIEERVRKLETLEPRLVIAQRDADDAYAKASQVEATLTKKVKR